MEKYFYNDLKKDLPQDQLHRLFKLVGWSDGSKTPEMINFYNVPFINSTLVISVWCNDKMIGVIRVLSDKVFRSIIYDLIVDPEFQNQGIGSELIKRCIEHFPNSEWTVGTEKHIAGYYEKLGFTKIDKGNGVYLSIPCKLFINKNYEI